MSLIDKYFKGWEFRTSKPTLEPGTEVNVFVNHYDDDVGIANIGDTRLYIEGVGPEHVEQRVRVEVTEFNENNSTGRGTFQQVVGQSSYTG